MYRVVHPVISPTKTYDIQEARLNALAETIVKGDITSDAERTSALKQVKNTLK